MTDTPTTRDYHSADWSALPSMVRRSLPPSAGFDPETGRKRYQCDQRELDRLAGAADTALVSAACSLRTLGLLAIYADARETAGNSTDQGDTITTLAELILALRDIQEAAKHGLPAGEDRP